MNELSSSAKAIGAVNTIIKRNDGFVQITYIYINIILFEII